MTAPGRVYALHTTSLDDPYPLYRWLRDHEPAHYSGEEDFWVVTRYADAVALFRDPATWSSQRRGNLIHDLPERVGKTLGTTDPPRHSWSRGLVQQAFTNKTVRGLLPTLRQLARELAERAHKDGQVEFVEAVSAPFNASVLGVMFGVPQAEFLRLRHWLDDFFLREEAAPGQETRQAVAMRELREYLSELAHARDRAPGQDLMSAMLAARDDAGGRLSVEEVVVTTMTFLTAGFESTNNLFTNLASALDQFPELFAELQDHPEAIPPFVEEGMRWDAPAQAFVRSPTRDVELHGRRIPEGSEVVVHIGAANRDERQFQDPDRFDLHRDNVIRHLGMGLGTHFCVGAPLGRAMAVQVFRELLRVADAWRVDRTRCERVRTPNFRGFARMGLALR